MQCQENDQTIYIKEKEVNTVTTFKYNMPSLFDANGGVEKDVNNRINAKPATMYKSECPAVINKKEMKLHTSEMRMLLCTRVKP